jgi:hypothetical protein
MNYEIILDESDYNGKVFKILVGYNDFIFKFTPQGREQSCLLKTLHSWLVHQKCKFQF